MEAAQAALPLLQDPTQHVLFHRRYPPQYEPFSSIPYLFPALPFGESSSSCFLTVNPGQHWRCTILPLFQLPFLGSVTISLLTAHISFPYPPKFSNSVTLRCCTCSLNPGTGVPAIITALYVNRAEKHHMGFSTSFMCVGLLLLYDAVACEQICLSQDYS